jgi:predicted RND superfamily exporter protein
MKEMPMSRTNELRQLVRTMLKASVLITESVDEIYYKNADVGAMFPHIIFSVKSVNLGYVDRKDYAITIDIYTKKNEKLSNEIADEIEDILNNANMPCGNILPTFFLNGRQDVIDEDKNIQHVIENIQAQLYEKEGVEND